MSTERIEIIVVRDPDGPTEIQLFADGEKVTDFTEYVIDAGAGHMWEDWTATRDENLRIASEGAREVLLEEYDDPPGGEYVEDRETNHWLYGIPDFDDYGPAPQPPKLSRDDKLARGPW
ncbi:hypothetical protein [Rhodococcus koreensis]